MKIRILFPVWLCLAAAAGASFAEEDDNTKLAERARDFLKTYCYKCHGEGGRQEANALDVSLYPTIIEKDNKYIVPKDLKASQIRDAIESGRMPYEDAPKPKPEEVAMIKDWIQKGAPAWPFIVETRPFVSDVDVLTAIRDDLRKADAVDRPFRRYFSLANLHNNFAGRRPVVPQTLALARAALSKAANSMSFESQIAVPEIVSKNGVVMRIDLRDFGWDKANQWPTILKSYPYGLKLNKSRDQNVRQLAEEVAELAGTELPCVRLDWFVDTATRPELYYKLLQLPETAQDVEKLLKVDVESDFQRDRLVRAGFAESGVSRSNRLVDRHSAAFGAYWKSYDFARSEGRGNLFKFPLGPTFNDNAFDRQAFKHDGGEMIFNLPNGLQGYYLTDAKGTRLDKGPITVVRDLQETGGSPEVLNGLSCMACHANGTKRFKDTIRTGLAVEGDARLKVDRLFPSPEKMRAILDGDDKRFQTAAAAAMGPFLNPGDPASVNITKYSEPIGLIAKNYQRDLTLEEAAAELGMPNAEALKAKIENNPRLMQLGIGPLATGAAIKREAWSALGGFLSTFHKVASELDIGTPHREI